MKKTKSMVFIDSAEATEEEIKNFFIAAAFDRMIDKIKEATS